MSKKDEIRLFNLHEHLKLHDPWTLRYTAHPMAGTSIPCEFAICECGLVTRTSYGKQCVTDTSFDLWNALPSNFDADLINALPANLRKKCIRINRYLLNQLNERRAADNIP